MDRGEAGRAAGAYRRAIEAEPGNGAAHWGLLFALNRAGRPEEAVREGERMLRETPQAWKLRLHWSLALVLAGDRERARRELREIAENSTDARTRDVAAAYEAGLGSDQEEELLGLYLGTTPGSAAP